MDLALEQARKALRLGEIPVGAVLVRDQRVLATAFNQPIRKLDPTAHAEILALRAAAKAVGNYRLIGTTLYVTAEPCLMCIGAVVHARVSSLVFGVSEPKFGCVRSLLRIEDLRVNHRFEVTGGVREEDCSKMLQDFFRVRRTKTLG